MRSTGMFLFAVLCSGLLLVSSPTNSQGGGKKRKAELAWAKGIANEFLESLLHERDKGNISTSPAVYFGPDLVNAKKETVDWGLERIAMQYRGAKFHIQAAETAPNGSEVILRGELEPLSEKEHLARIKRDGKELEDEYIQGKTEGSRQDKPANFTLWLAKESETGRWKVRFMRVKAKSEK